MRRLVLFLLTLSLCAAATPVMAASPEPSAAPLSTSARAITAVRALDPRFADLGDYADAARRQASSFDFAPTMADSWIRVLPTFGEFVDMAGVSGAPAWLDYGERIVEVMLVADCEASVKTFTDTDTDPDPCGWRHTWLYRVTPAGEVVPLYDAGSPDAP